MNTVSSAGELTPDATIDSRPGDSDAKRVIDVLNGARRNSRDPDVELAQVLAELRSVPDELIRAALASLVAHADPD